MANGPKVSHRRLTALLDYDPVTGVFRWKIANCRADIGDVAGHFEYRGYCNIGIDGRKYSRASSESRAMTIRAPPFPIDNHWRRSTKELNDEFVEEVLALWNQKIDTFEIAQTTFETQATCERALHIGLERRRQITWRKIGSPQAQDGSTKV